MKCWCHCKDGEISITDQHGANTPNIIIHINMSNNLSQLDRIERNSLLAAKNVLNIEDVAYLTGYSKSKLYKLTCDRKIPHYKPNSRVLYFDRKEIEDWMRQNRIASTDEIETQAAEYNHRRS